jgi:hypothetical protein
VAVRPILISYFMCSYVSSVSYVSAVSPFHMKQLKDETRMCFRIRQLKGKKKFNGGKT